MCCALLPRKLGEDNGTRPCNPEQAGAPVLGHPSPCSYTLALNSMQMLASIKANLGEY